MAEGKLPSPGPSEIDKRAERQALVIFWTMVAFAVTTAIGVIAAVVNLIVTFM